MARRILPVATQMQARTEGLDGLKLPMEELPDNMGRRFASTAAGALAASHINAQSATADTDAALAATQGATTT